MKPSKYTRVAWTPFVRDRLPPVTEEMVRAKAIEFKVSEEEVRKVLLDTAKDEVWVNSLYQVNIRTLEPREGSVWPVVKHLSIKRRDKAVVHDWRDLQRIKNELVGPECEAVEIYPAESRLVDTANQYHLWVFNDPEFRFPLGFGTRLVANKGTESTRQRQRK